MKIAIYTRVSTKDQNHKLQLNLCNEYCERLGYEVYKVYSDIGESGKKESRPQFDLMLEDMRRFKFKGICVYKIDRIGRSLPHLVRLFEEFKRKKINFISVTQNFDTTTPEGNMFMQMMMILAEYERVLTVSRVKAGQERARREGKKIGRPRVKVNKYEVLRLKDQGLSYRKIAEKVGCSLGAVQRCIKTQPPK